MHIALFTDFHPGTVGGIQTSVTAQCRGLQRSGHRVTVFAAPGPESTGPDPDLVVLSGVPGLSVNGFATVLPTRANNRLIDTVFAARGPIDLVHVHTTYGVAVAGVKAARRHGIPLVQTLHSRDDVFIENTSPAPYPAALALRVLHGRFVPHRGRMPVNPESRAARHAWWTMTAQAQAADAVIVVSEHFARRLRSHGYTGPLHVVSNGIDDNLLDDLGPRDDRATAPATVTSGEPGSDAAAPDTATSGTPAPAMTASDSPVRPAGTGADKHGPGTGADGDGVRGGTGQETEDSADSADSAHRLRVLWCARLSAEKRPLAAVEAVLQVPDCRLDVYGDGDQLAPARALVAARGATGRVRFHGARPNAECLRAMREHDVLLFPSRGFDTQGMALLEAVATGLPVVYCDPDLSESVPAGGGICTPDPGPGALAAALRELAAKPDCLVSMRERLAAEQDSVRQSKLTARITEIYGGLITDNPCRRMPRTLAEVPTAPGRLPLLGHSAAVLGDSLGFVRSLAAAGPVVRVYLGPRPAYVLTTPDLVRQVGFGTAGEFQREDLRVAVHEVIRGASNVLTGTPHELRRRMIAPALRQRRLHDYATVAADLATAWAAALPAGRPVNLLDEAHRLVLDTLSSTLFTADFGAAAKDEVRRNVPWLLGQVVQRAALPAPVRRLRVVANRRFATKAAALRAEIGAVVTAYRAADHDFHDVLSALVRHRDPETGTTLSDEEIIDELILMLAAGVGSTASILAWVWYEILRDPQIAGTVRTELRTVAGTGPVRPDHLYALPYLRQVILETLRYWGPWVSIQNASGPVTFDGLTLPGDATVVYSPYLIHHDPRYYPDPGTFDPDRWSPARTAQIDKKAILPFGVGTRHCPGNNFAVMTITLATAALFTCWTPVLRPAARVRPSNGDFVPAPSRLPVTLTPRNSSWK
ncbi:cytochrome P450 [Nocardia sp. NPDC051750]|uniref:cytochrome P450 n=1 Tax=Nocardia sp. NPDC051750 TaxID=3364325 RepID=UPI0037986954